MLVVHELRGRKMPGAAELRGRQRQRPPAFHRFGHRNLLNGRLAPPPRDLRAKRQELVRVGDDGGAIHGRQSRDRVHRLFERLLPYVRLPALTAFSHQCGQLAKRRGDRVRNRLGDRVPPHRRS